MIARLASAALFATSMGLSAIAADALPADDDPEPDAVFGADDRNWGAPRIIVEPEYPKEALAKGIVGTVNVTGVLDSMGQLSNVSYAVGSDEALVFVPALKDVMQFWRFHAAPAKDCLPGGKRIMTRVWFEIDSGKPKISVARGYEHESPRTKSSDRPDMKPIERFDPRFPPSMLRYPSGSEAWVFARIEIDIDGNVSKAVAKGFPQRERELKDFERSAESALSRWKFPPAPPDRQRLRVGCYTIVYHLH